MERFVKGDDIVIPFPFTDLSGTKRRPALVLADLPGDEIILCQITSQQNDNNAIPSDISSFFWGHCLFALISVLQEYLLPIKI